MKATTLLQQFRLIKQLKLMITRARTEVITLDRCLPRSCPNRGRLFWSSRRRHRESTHRRRRGRTHRRRRWCTFGRHHWSNPFFLDRNLRHHILVLRGKKALRLAEMRHWTNPQEKSWDRTNLTQDRTNLTQDRTNLTRQDKFDRRGQIWHETGQIWHKTSKKTKCETIWIHLEEVLDITQWEV